MAKISSKKILGKILLTLAGITATSNAQVRTVESPAIRILLDRAKVQAQSGHLDIAAATWRQVLISEPNNMEALRGLASAEAQLGHRQAAEGYIQRLRKLGASANIIGELQSLKARPDDAELLKQAAVLSKSGQYSQAMEIYRKLYDNRPPVGEIALVYYDTEAALPTERGRAIEGLRKLAQQFPADERYSVTLGRVLTYDATTRPEGMSLLQRYPSNRAAQDALKQATQWNQQAAIAPTFQTTIPTAPSARSTTPQSNLAKGFRALNSGNLSSAEQHFRASLSKESTHGQAYAGLGFVSMRQQRFEEATRYFERAHVEGDRDTSVSQALETSRFWILMGRGRNALDANDVDTATTEYRNALALKPDDGDALTALGGTLLRAGRAQDAIPSLQRAVQSNSKSLQTWRTLFLAQTQANQYADAVKTAELLPSSLRKQLESDTDFLAGLAKDYHEMGEVALSDRILKRALELVQPEDEAGASLAKQLQYASLLMTAKQYNNALRSYRNILDRDPENSNAWRGAVSAEHLSGRDSEALRIVRQIPSSVSLSLQTDPDFLSMLGGIYQSQGQINEARTVLKRALQIRSSLSLQLQLASVEMSSGNKEYAAQIYQQIVDKHPESEAGWVGQIQALHAMDRDHEALRQIDRMSEDIRSSLQGDPNFFLSAASIYSATGNLRHAVSLVQQANSLYAEQGGEPPTSNLIQEGWIWLRAGDNSQLAATIKQLNSRDDLTADQQQEVTRLWSSWALQRAAFFRQQAQPEAAITVLATALRAFPSDLSINNTLADTYLETGDAKRAVLLYKRQDISQANKTVCASAIRAALAAKDKKQTEAWLQSSLDRFGRDASILQLAAEFEQQRGDSRRAAAYYRAALQAAGPPSIEELTSSSHASSSLRNTPVSTTQELFQMLSSSGNQGHQIISAQRQNREDSLNSLWPDRSTTAQSLSSFAGRQDRSWPSSTSPDRSDRSSNMDTNSPSVDPFFDPPRAKISQKNPTTYRPLYANRDSKENTWPIADSPLPSLKSNHPATSIDTTNTVPSIPAFPEDQKAELPAKQWMPPKRNDSIAPLDSQETTATLTPLPTPTLEPLPSLTGSAPVVQRPLTPREDMQQHLEAIQAASSPYLGGRSWVGFHSGQPGYDRLTIFTADIEQSSMIANNARLTVIVHPTLLQGGTTSSDATFQLGTLPLGAIANAQSSAGVGGELQLRTRSFGAAIGYTPHGFLVENVTGRLLVQPNAGPVTFTFERQPIEDSQLSFAGLRDPGSISPTFRGNIWGGTISNAASLQINRGDATSGWYMSVGGQYITGKHIPSNTRIDGYAGAYWSTWEKPGYGKLTLGMNLFGMHFANNQRLFTYGNGGYFSPGAYLLSNVPLTFEGRYRTRFHYRAAGSIGLQAFQEEAAPYYPLDRSLQLANNNPYIPSRTSVGANYNMEGEGSYLMMEHWHVGGFFSFDNSRNYNNSRVGFYLRYISHPQSLDSQMGPTGIDRNRGLRPLQIP